VRGEGRGVPQEEASITGGVIDDWAGREGAEYFAWSQLTEEPRSVADSKQLDYEMAQLLPVINRVKTTLLSQLPHAHRFF